MKRGLLALVPAVLACGGPPPQTVQLREAVATAATPTARGVAFRLPAQRGAARLHALPTLEPVPASLDPGPGTERPVGFAADDDLVYTLSRGTLLALDLRIGRFRTLDSNVTLAAAAPTGTVALAHTSGGLGLASDRRVTPAGRVPVDHRLEQVWATPGGRAAAVVVGDSGRRLLVLSGGSVTSRRPLPDGPLARSAWGDAVAVAGPDGIELVEVLRDVAPLRVRLRPLVHALAFSASGHRLYVATDEPAVVELERYEGDVLGRFSVPGPLRVLRADEFGRYLFGATGDALVVIDLRTGTVSAPEGDWGEDLPAAGPDGTLLLRRGDDVVALGAPDSAPRGRVAGGGRDRWLVAAWTPGAQAVGGPRDVAPVGAAPTAGQEIFVQVSSTSNAQWAEGLAADLRQAGMRARVLPPTTVEEMYRVVLGPYGTRDEAESIGRKLGMPFWIFQRDTASASRTGTP